MFAGEPFAEHAAGMPRLVGHPQTVDPKMEVNGSGSSRAEDYPRRRGREADSQKET